ncbi:MAG: hypothetical protein A3J37_05635 [Alphaproteobacteria bacterium RIFCSPHIGHO2_12_FULL_45_9]|nr:MAG: hypothetical protein A3J37_05635 [Alphaproteobacteria bacterium RIFCSPHIGHO2_12_FULL_45_9]
MLLFDVVESPILRVVIVGKLPLVSVVMLPPLVLAAKSFRLKAKADLNMLPTLSPVMLVPTTEAPVESATFSTI